MSRLSVCVKGTQLDYDPETLLFTLTRGNAVWQTEQAPCIQFSRPTGEDRPYPWADLPADIHTVSLASAGIMETKLWKTGLGEGFITRFAAIPGTSLTLETLLWIDYDRGDLYAELIPGQEPDDRSSKENGQISNQENEQMSNQETGQLSGQNRENGWHAIVFPASFAFAESGPKSYTLINQRQGLMLPNGHADDCKPVTYGQYCSAAAYMPWFGQVRGEDAYIAIGVTPFDGGYLLENHPGHMKTIAQYWLPSLGRMDYRRVVRYTFTQGDYNDLARIYRQYAHESGLLVTLAEKAVRNPNVARLIGCAIVHEGIYHNIQPESNYYDHEHPENNTRLLASFDERARQMRALKEKWGLDKVYFHMDGWGVDGYDSHHPDYLPPNAPAGGWEGMRRLSDTMDELGYLLATHDQYRDYHYNASSFDEEMAVHDIHGQIVTHGYWYGGKQSYLCSALAPGYVRRNYASLKEHGINLKGTYQDVFTIVDLDECSHPWHRVTREQCAAYRKACFDYVMANGIAISSEEIIDWGMQTLVFCHHAPQVPSVAPDFAKGIPVPLANLVYHDCVLQPAFLGYGPSYTSDLADKQNGLLLALLNGNAGYLPIEPTAEEVERYKIVASLQEKTQHCELLRHKYLSPTRQQTVFANGITVTIDTETDMYQIDGLE